MSDTSIGVCVGPQPVDQMVGDRVTSPVGRVQLPDHPATGIGPHPTFVHKLSFATKLTSAPITLCVIVLCLAAHWSEFLTNAWQLANSHSTVVGFSRLFTGHLTHWSLDQLFWDVLAFGVLGYFCEQTGRKRMLGLLLFSMATVSLAVKIHHPEMATYRGLSGVDSALFVFLACHIGYTGFRRQDRTWLLGGGVAWLVFVGKISFELLTGQTLFVESASDFQTLPISHVAGAVAGSITWLLVVLTNSTSPNGSATPGVAET